MYDWEEGSHTKGKRKHKRVSYSECCFATCSTMCILVIFCGMVWRVRVGSVAAVRVASGWPCRPLHNSTAVGPAQPDVSST